MASPRDGSNGRVDGDGVRIVRSQRVRLDTWGVVVAGVVVVWVALRLGRPPAPSPPTAPATKAVRLAADTRSGPAPVPPASDATRASADDRDVRRREIVARRLARKILPRTHGPDGKPEAHAADAIAALRAAGVTDGIAAFAPPGTSPPRSGVIVPDDVALPEGYLRHHQTTDDGEALPPILLFHPDYEFFDESGTRVDVPADLVVPPELVPPDIPIEILTPPGAAPRQP